MSDSGVHLSTPVSTSINRSNDEVMNLLQLLLEQQNTVKEQQNVKFNEMKE